MQEKTKVVTLALDANVYDQFTSYCRKEGLVRSKLISQLIKNYLEREKNE
jgi:metal-responsive CopG/Arc/MetJ family transcriptional regulator